MDNNTICGWQTSHYLCFIVIISYTILADHKKCLFEWFYINLNKPFYFIHLLVYHTKPVSATISQGTHAKKSTVYNHSKLYKLPTSRTQVRWYQLALWWVFSARLSQGVFQRAANNVSVYVYSNYRPIAMLPSLIRISQTPVTVNYITSRLY